jgi:[ribosomal protein S18]-alanine N-acetyltransferase
MFSLFKKTFKIDRATPQDVKALSALHATGFARGWTQDEFTSLLLAQNTLALCMRQSVRQKALGQPLGLIIWRIAADEAEILTLIVDKKIRGQGQGRALLQASLSPLMQRGVSALFLEVESENAPALRLYQQFGFAQVGLRKGYYAGKDALIFKKLIA